MHFRLTRLTHSSLQPDWAPCWSVIVVLEWQRQEVGTPPSAPLYIYDLWSKNKCMSILRAQASVTEGRFPDIFAVKQRWRRHVCRRPPVTFPPVSVHPWPTILWKEQWLWRPRPWLFPSPDFAPNLLFNCSESKCLPLWNSNNPLWVPYCLCFMMFCWR